MNISFNHVYARLHAWFCHIIRKMILHTWDRPREPIISFLYKLTLIYHMEKHSETSGLYFFRCYYSSRWQDDFQDKGWY